MNSKRFWILVIIVFISGLSQGMLLPLMAVLLEQRGIASSINGLHATGLYIGVLLASPFMEGPLRKFGYKPLILAGGMTVILSMVSFPLWPNLLFWFLLRLLIGVGDHALHFSTQTWITTFSEEEKRGRNLSIYGLSYGVGFAVGPLLARLVTIHEYLPFYTSSFLSLIAWSFVFFLKNEKPAQRESEIDFYSIKSTFGRFSQVLSLAWAPILPAFCYGILEASLNSNFPVFGLRIGFDVNTVTTIVSAFFIGGIVFQIPLGIISDRIGRKKVLIAVQLLGSFVFLFAGIFSASPLLLIVCFFVSGMLLGSNFSLSMAYMTDSLPKYLLPAGNLMVGIGFSFGSILGPFAGGLAIEYLPSANFLYFIAISLGILSLSMFSYSKSHHGQVK